MAQLRLRPRPPSRRSRCGCEEGGGRVLVHFPLEIKFPALSLQRTQGPRTGQPREETARESLGQPTKNGKDWPPAKETQMNIFQRWKQTTIANKGLVFSSFLMAFGTLFYAGAAVVQVCIMRQSARDVSLQTSKLIEAAQAQACAASKSAEAAASFAGSADKISQETARASSELHRTANDSETASKLDHRAWFGISDFDVVQYDPDDSHKPFRIRVSFRNSGKTPARQVHVLGQFQVYKPNSDGPNEADWNLLMGFFNQSKERYVTAPDATRKYIVNDSSNNIITQNYQAIKDHLLYAYYFGQATYVDNDNRLRTTRFCLMLGEPETKQLAHCGKGNDMD